MLALKPKTFHRYYEPFLGGGALFFALKPNHATLNDYNTSLINAYEQIRDNKDALIEQLYYHKERDAKDYYLDMRHMDRDGRLDGLNATEKAARLLYMLSANFNGIYKVNAKGQFNVPYGHGVSKSWIDEALFERIHSFLQMNDITLLNGDFEQAISTAKSGDFVYFDPPYVPIKDKSVKYIGTGFDMKEQERLRDVYLDLTQRGVYVMLSNSDTEPVYQLYGNLPQTNLTTVGIYRLLNANGLKRGKVNELIIRNYE